MLADDIATPGWRLSLATVVAKLSPQYVTGVTLVKLPYAQESRQQDPVTL